VNKPVVNHTASVHQRLLNLAKERGRPFNELLQYYAIERFLFRLAQSQYRDRLKAAQHVLGHATPDMTLTYAERDQAAASRIAPEGG
jgi:hypothetical protein